MPIEKPIVRNQIQARAGYQDWPVTAVLGISLGLVGALFAVIWYWYFGGGFG